MSEEQIQPQAEPPQAPPQTGQQESRPGQPGQTFRRRKRRRKKNKGGANAANVAAGAQPNGQPQANGQQMRPPQQQQHRPQHQGQNGNGGGHQRRGNGGGYGNGNGGGGGRRRNKQRRQTTFVGPMDHSYRSVNGNFSDASPATIAMHRDPNTQGNAHSGFYPQEPPVFIPVLPIREDAPTRIYCFIEDLFFLAKIQETARKVGVKVAFVKNDKESIAKLTEGDENERPSLIVFDLNNFNAKPLQLIPKIKAKLKKSTSIIGFLQHVQADLKAKAIEAGCDTVMPRSAFSQNLPNLLRRHGLDEEAHEHNVIEANY
jgi:hypothetical protein